MNNTTSKTDWAPTFPNPSDTSAGEYVGVLDFQDNKEEWHHFEVIATGERIAFGSGCNVGFLESGYLPREEGESLDTGLQELLADLECYYNDGARYVSRIVCTERM